jgi:hypothetical protein
VGWALMVARGWGCGRFSDDPTLSGDPRRATIKVAPTDIDGLFFG